MTSGKEIRPRVHGSPVSDCCDPSDWTDIRNSLAGDSEAYQRLIKRHQEHIARIMWRFSRDRFVHEELMQDVFVEAYLSLNSYRAKAPFEHWLSRIATRVGYHFWKSQSRQQKESTFRIRDWDRIVSGAFEIIEAQEAAQVLHGLLSRLPARDRLVLNLRYLEGCDVSETAQRTGWSETMVKVQTLRARRKLKKLLEST